MNKQWSSQLIGVTEKMNQDKKQTNNFDESINPGLGVIFASLSYYCLFWKSTACDGFHILLNNKNR